MTDTAEQAEESPDYRDCLTHFIYSRHMKVLNYTATCVRDHEGLVKISVTARLPKEDSP